MGSGLPGLLFGVLMLLLGIRWMSAGLRHLSGTRLREWISRASASPWRGALLGVLITGTWQSSSMTTVLLVALVDGGAMTLAEAAPVVMGANVGTTVTAQLMTWDASGYVVFFLFTGLVLTGAAADLPGRPAAVAAAGRVLLSLGVLFAGLDVMSRAASGLGNSPAFLGWTLAVSRSPALGLLVGALSTAAIQSSSAGVGVLQTLMRSGFLSLGGALPVVIGQNVGTTATAFIASLGSGREARRVALLHLVFNLIGVAVFMPFLPLVVRAVKTAALPDPAQELALAHFLFNLTNLFLQIPFVKPLTAFITWMYPDPRSAG